MKTQNCGRRIACVLLLVVGSLAAFSSLKADVVYDNSSTQTYNFASGGCEFGDEVMLAGGVGRYLTNFTFQYFGSNFSGAVQICLRLYRNDGAAYGTNYNAPGTMLYDSGFWPISETDGATLSFDNVNSGFAVPVPSTFTWTVEFSGLTNGAVAGLAVYNPPTVGSSFNEFWELSGTNGSWNYLTAGVGTNINFGAIAYAAPVVADTAAPTVSIVSPANKARFFAGNYTPAVTGTASDNTKLGLVLFKLNGGNYRPATTANGWTNWTAVGTWALGANTMFVKSVDAAGNESSVVANTYTLRVTNAITIEIHQPAGTDNSTKSITSGSPLEIGKYYTLVAVPDSKSIFSNWTSTAVGYGSTSARYKFQMTNNLALAANFVTNRFYDSEGFYYGLFNSEAATFTNAGFMKIKVRARSGKTATFSGTIYVDGNSKGISGEFQVDGSGSVKKQIDRSKWSKQPLWVYVNLPFDGSDTLTGYVSNTAGAWVSTLLANRAVTATNFTGTYTMSLPGDVNNSSAVPGGSGYGLVKIDSSGVVRLAGSKLADGQNLGQKVNVSKSGVWPLYSRANSAGSGQFNSMIWGWAGVTNDLTGNLTWIKKTASGGTRYTNGFELSVPIMSSPYFASDPGGTQIMSLASDVATYVDGTNPDLTNSVTLSLLGATPKNKFTTDKVRKLSLLLTPKTGKFSITFENPYDADNKSKGFGVVLTNMSIGQGYVLPLGGTTSGSFTVE